MGEITTIGDTLGDNFERFKDYLKSTGQSSDGLAIVSKPELMREGVFFVFGKAGFTTYAISESSIRPDGSVVVEEGFISGRRYTNHPNLGSTCEAEYLFRVGKNAPSQPSEPVVISRDKFLDHAVYMMR